MGWTGRGSCGGWTVKPILKEVELMSFQLISFHDAIPLLAACDCFHPIPNLLQVVFLQLLLHLPPVLLLSLFQLSLEFPLYVPQLCLVPLFKCPLLLIEEIFDIAGYPGLVIRKAAYSPCGNNNIHAEVQVVSSVVSDSLNVLAV